MLFAPIAVVGRGCVLPGALDPSALWSAVVSGSPTLTPVTADRWDVPPVTVHAPRRPCPDRVCSDIGGFVEGFDTVFRPAALGWDPFEAAQYDPLFRWTVHGVGAALDTVPGARHSTRTGLVMGNLTYPTKSLARITSRRHLTGQAFPTGVHDAATQPRNRFSFGHPAALAATLHGLGAGALTLDAACASSLYALKIACDRLHDRSADVMVAGGASGADNLFIQMGFTALSALSPSGRSLPLDARADGLLPAEGAAFVTLTRLDDALARGLDVLAVIRGIGWSNNGRGVLVAPDEDAQERVMRDTYRQSGIAPEDIGLLEFHATGTPVGDEAEIRSTARVFAAAANLPIGAAKATFGHALPAAGMVGLLKLIGALEAGTVPPVTGMQEPSPVLAGTPFRLPRAPEPWTGPRRAGLSAFGFGGSNAHLILEGPPAPSPHEHRPPARLPGARPRAAEPAPPTARPTVPKDTAPVLSAQDEQAPAQDEQAPAHAAVAVVGLGVRLGAGADTADFVRDLVTGGRKEGEPGPVRLSLTELHCPPADFADAHPQHAMLMAACQEAAHGVRLTADRTMVIVGAESTPATSDFQLRWRPAPAALPPEAVERTGNSAAVPQPLSANAAIRHMGAVLANQVNVALNLTGSGFAVGEQEASGLAALRLALRAVRAGECDSAVVGAVGTPDEPVHRDVLAALDRSAEPVDAAVVLTIKRADLAARDGDRVLALLPGDPDPGSGHGGDAEQDGAPALIVGDISPRDHERPGTTALDLAAFLGHADCAHGMVAVAAAVVALSRGVLPRPGAAARPWLGKRRAQVTVRTADTHGTHHLRLDAAPGSPRAVLTEQPPRLHVYSGDGVVDVLEHAQTYQESDRGPARLVVQATGEAQLRDRVQAAKRWLRDGGARPEGAHYRDRPIDGGIAFVYTGGAATYPDMGRSLLLAAPDTLTELARRSGGPLGPLVQWLYDDADRLAHASDRADRTAMQRIWGSIMLSTVHTSLSRDVLGLRPDGVIGYSSGATSALICLDYWRELAPLLRDSTVDPLFHGLLTGACEAVREEWRERAIEGKRWATHLVGASATAVHAALAGERAVHLSADNSPTCCTIAGEEDACARVLTALRPDYAFRLEYDVAVHVPEVERVADRWRRFHHRPVTPLPGVRFYDCATASSFEPTADSVADALTAQATGTIRFADTVRQAYRDGVRIFIEHGPRQACTGWTGEILRRREHLAVALDAAPDRSLRHLFDATAQLAAAGVRVDHEALTRRFTPPPSHLATAARTITVRRATATLPPPLPSAVAETPAEPAPEATPAPPAGTPGILFDRDQLEYLARHPVSPLFGERFRAQDGRRRQTRVPTPPMLLIDRVTGIEAEPGTMGTGVIWTETDVTAESWFLDPAGRMTPGATVEAGQADLLLISWLGAGLHLDENRVYRLLGCDLTFHGPLPRPGETLRYRIEITGHARHEGVHLFFFQYDCWVGDERRITVRGGQAGFFTDAELEASAGVLWNPTELGPATGDVPDGTCRVFDDDQVRALVQGRADVCFGPGWETTRSHLRTPRIPTAGRHQLFDRVTHFEPAGGPTGGGYLRAELDLRNDMWFFDGHFHEDPCMPGTLMLDGGYQAMAFHLTALGLTVDRDGWRFEPVRGESSRMRCRGQAVPTSQQLVYELYVTRVTQGPEPELRADLLCTVDGRPSFHAAGLALKLVPDTPLAGWKARALAPGARSETLPVPAADLFAPQPVDRAVVVDGTPLDRDSMLDSAWGPVRDALGPAFRDLAEHRRLPRLPGPPYLCMDRVTALGATPACPAEGSWVEAEFDLRDDAWFWQDAGERLPTAILMESALQPCGWLAQFTACAPDSGQDLHFRNLDGDTTVLADVPRSTRTLRTRATLTGITTSDTMVLVFFAVECFADDTLSLACTTSFGYFPPGAFDQAPGLRRPPDQAAPEPAGDDSGAPPQSVDLTRRPERYHTGPLRLGHPRLVVPQRTVHDVRGGPAGLGSISGVKDVDPDDWYFKAHFFQDPVQPGSLGVEAMYQLLRALLIEKDFGAGMRAPRFEIGNAAEPLAWKYRGQVTPRARQTVVDVHITETTETTEGRSALADAWLSVDGTVIYHVRNIGLRVVDAAPPPAPDHFAVQTLDPATDTWLGDHRPTWTAPALAATVVADLLAGASVRHTGRPARALRDITLERWVVLDTPRHLLVEVRARQDRTETVLHLWRPSRKRPDFSRYEPVARATVLHTEPPLPERPPELLDARPVPTSPYDDGRLFHGPAFQSLVALHTGPRGATGVLDAGRCTVPPGILGPGLLDGALHVIPHAALHQWDPGIPSDVAAYPQLISRLDLHAPPPTGGAVRVEARFAGFRDGDPGRPEIDVWLNAGGAPVATLRIEERLLPLGRLARYSPEEIRAFLRREQGLPGGGLAHIDGPETHTDTSDVRMIDWFPHTVATVYDLPASTRGADLVDAIALREHVAQRRGIHPVLVKPGLAGQAHALDAPLTLHHLSLRRTTRGTTVTDCEPPSLDVERVMRWWRKEHRGDWPGHNVLAALLHGFLAGLHVPAPAHADPSPHLRAGRLYVHGPDSEPAALVFAAANSALRERATLLLRPEPWTRRLLSAIFDGPAAHQDPRHCPCAPDTSDVVTRTRAHLAHGGDVLVLAQGDAAESLHATLGAAIEAHNAVHPLLFLPLPAKTAREHRAPARRRACHHRLASALPHASLRQDPVAVVTAALDALAAPQLPHPSFMPHSLGTVPNIRGERRALTQEEADDALLKSLLDLHAHTPHLKTTPPAPPPRTADPPHDPSRPRPSQPAETLEAPPRRQP
ncbi:beta-ketoacyl synthase N-terminal-like domain-containing protein [Streptomyces sp. NPDC002779]|uniref:beta-ketoacyl synthase N-terminal-like domain-containing protein n=1 Tax=Streptomyces sp. NPDC002779 TaxID=3364664 RepID=UPI0036BED1A2